MKRIAYSLIATLFAQAAMTQNLTSSSSPSVWLKGKSDTINIEKTASPYHFNFNPVIVPDTRQGINFKNVLPEKYSLFAVFQSDSEDEVNLIELKHNRKTTAITNKKVFNEKENIFRKVEAKDGMLLSYIVSREAKGSKKSSIILQNHATANNAEGNRNDIMELICYPGIIEELQRKKIESYLSIKYGISLLGEVDYISSEEQKIWDSKENGAYKSRVTGIGRDDKFGLYQKQSGNAQKDGLYLALGEFHQSNSANKNKMPDGSFLLWADNDGALAIKAEKKGPANVKKMKRIWKMQSTVQEQALPLSTQLMIDKSSFSFDTDKQKEGDIKKDDYVWLVIDRNSNALMDYLNAEYYRQSRDEEGRLFFDNIEWDTDKSGADTFTFVKGPDFFVEYALSETDCQEERTTAKLAIIGGKAPYSIKISGTSSLQSHNTEERLFSIPELEDTLVTVKVDDSRKRHQVDTLHLQNPKRIRVTLEEQWTLGAKSDQVVVVPKIENPETQQLKFAWKKGDEVLSTQRQFTATEEGDYVLSVSNAIGCEEELPFKISNMSQVGSGLWTLYPNPAKRDENFNIRFDLEKESDVSVAVFDISNKLVKHKSLGILKNFEYSETLSTIGTFLVVVTIDGKATSGKIIIR